LLRGITQAGHRLALLFDEVPWWIDELREREGDDAARLALAGLRSLRQRDERLRMVLTGSIGLAGLAMKLGASAEINDLVPMALAPLDQEAGEALVAHEAKALGIGVSAAAAQHLGASAAGSPHWMRVLLQRLSARDSIEVEDVDREVEQLLAPRNKALFDEDVRGHLLHRHGLETGTQMQAVLAAVAAERDGAPMERLVLAALAARVPTREAAQALVYVLTDEYYLSDGADGRFKFLNPLLKRWLKRNVESA
jgi:hypothetical protein